MKPIRIFLTGIIVLSFGGCGSSHSLNPLSLLTGNSWALNTLLGQGLDLSKFSQGIPSLSFLEGGRLAGFTGCNNFSGGFSLEGKDLKLDPGAMTKKACAGNGEDQFMAALSQVKNFKVGKDQLTLLDGAKELMSFVPKED